MSITTSTTVSFILQPKRGASNGAETLLFIVDENTVTFKKNIPLNFAIDIRQQIAVSSTRHVYIPDGTVVLCLSNTDEIMGQLTIPTHDSSLGELVSVGGVCVDNANNRLLVNCFYETIGGLSQFAIAEFSTKDNRFIRLSGIDFKSEAPVSDAYVNEKKQTVIVLARNRIYVYSLRDYSVLNVFLLGEETYLQASNYIDASDTLVVAYTQGGEVIEVITLKNISQQ